MTQHIIDTDELEPCPFCGSHNISAGEVGGNHLDGTYFVQTACINCGALSPEAKTETESVELWNRRKANSPQADGMVKDLSKIARQLSSLADNGVTETLPDAMREASKQIFARLSNKTTGAETLLSAYKPQADGMVLVPVTINRDGKEFRLISNNYGTVSDISLELKVYFDAGALSAYKPQADDVRKDAERWRTFREIASEEMCYALCGNSNADNDELDQAIDKARE